MMNCFHNHSCVSNELAHDANMILAKLLMVSPDQILTNMWPMMIIHPYHRPVLNLDATFRGSDVLLSPKGDDYVIVIMGNIFQC